MLGSDLGGLGFGGCRRSCLGGSRFEGRGFWILEGRGTGTAGFGSWRVMPNLSSQFSTLKT